jgi:16S rRNA (adenine1518-N6/adenine1519-N6)-dimethyltransferase
MSDHRAKKRFGQNFLRDHGVINRIIDTIQPQHDDLMVEIGPGQAALTRPLLTQLTHLHVVELDRDLIPGLKSLAKAQQLTIHQADALSYDFNALGEHLRVVGNLPYNISTPLLFHLFYTGNNIRDMHFMLQKEVVNRLGAEPGSKDYGRLSVMTQYHCHVEPLFVVDPAAFTPRPKVDSRIVRLTPHATPPVTVNDYLRFEHMVRDCFSQRRKTLRNNLKHQLSAEQIEALEIDPGIRAERLTLAQFAALSNAIQA